MEDKPIWVLVNCNSEEEAETIGNELLQKRLGSCFDIFPRKMAAYFWPPKSKTIEKSVGALLIFETMKGEFPKIKKFVKGIHSDELPFIGFISIEGTDEEYVEWIKGELKE